MIEIDLNKDYAMVRLVNTQLNILFLKMTIYHSALMNSKSLNYPFIMHQFPQSFFYNLNTLRLIYLYIINNISYKKKLRGKI